MKHTVTIDVALVIEYDDKTATGTAHYNALDDWLYEGPIQDEHAGEWMDENIAPIVNRLPIIEATIAFERAPNGAITIRNYKG